MANYTGTTGDDTQSGTKHDDVFSFSQGGRDAIKGKGGDDNIGMGDGLDSRDKIDGGDGVDTLQVSTAGTLTVTFRAATMTNVEYLQFNTGNFHFVLNDANVAAGAHLAVLGSGATSLFFDGSAETDGTFTMDTSAGNDTLIGGQQNDVIGGGTTFFSAGNDTLDGQGGDDIFTFFDDFTKFDKVTGGTGHDTIKLDGNYFASVVFLSTTMVGVEEIDLDTAGGGFGYNLKFHDGNLASGETLAVYANTAVNATLDGSLEANAHFNFYGGANFDDLFGGGGADILQGAGEADLLQGNGGADIFVYGGAADSTGPNYDTVLDFDANNDKFLVPVQVTGVDATVTHGNLTDANFNSDLAGVIGSGKLAKHHAVVYQPDSGDHIGDSFLIVDLNNSNGYQADVDLVINITGVTHLTGLGPEDFILTI